MTENNIRPIIDPSKPKVYIVTYGILEDREDHFAVVYIHLAAVGLNVYLWL